MREKEAGRKGGMRERDPHPPTHTQIWETDRGRETNREDEVSERGSVCERGRGRHRQRQRQKERCTERERGRERDVCDSFDKNSLMIFRNWIYHSSNPVSHAHKSALNN